MYLICATCQTEFLASQRQAKRARSTSGKQTKFACSSACAYAQISKSKTKPIPQRGPCPTCGQLFYSRLPKRFCSLACYTKSPEFTATRQAATESAKRLRETRLGRSTDPTERVCLECGIHFFAQPSNPKKFCSQTHYRLYLSKRFDRQIASPETMRLPQAYDEFLTLAELPCLIDGCQWRGQALSYHMNFAHGFTAAEFKRAAGFNLTTGVVSLPLHDALCARPHILGAQFGEIDLTKPRQTKNYTSLESREHWHKAYALKGSEEGPQRICENCGRAFPQSTPFGLTKYCSTKCRSQFYEWRRAWPARSCAVCSTVFLPNTSQNRRAVRGKPITCSVRCRNILNLQALRGVAAGG